MDWRRSPDRHPLDKLIDTPDQAIWIYDSFGGDAALGHVRSMLAQMASIRLDKVDVRTVSDGLENALVNNVPRDEQIALQRLLSDKAADFYWRCGR